MRQVGAIFYQGQSCHFTVWAPFAEDVRLSITSPEAIFIKMQKQGNGYWHAESNKIQPGAKYFFSLDGKNFPDPASNYQPNGVHADSEVVDHSFNWTDADWETPAIKELILYELHTGTFSRKGDFKGISDHIAHLKKTGINAISLMPVAQFPGQRNWGYDGTYPYAVQNSYGGVKAFKELINTCHKNGIAVILDVVYNHLGPEGDYFGNFGPYFTNKYKTPWGKAINFDDEYSDEVRNYFLQNAIYWFEKFHIDGLRLDAVHAIKDHSAYPFLRELKDVVAAYNLKNSKNHFLIAESSLNDTKVVRPAAEGGWGHDAQWMDDFHHAVHARLTGEKKGYYADHGETEQIVKSLREGYVLSGNYSLHRKRRYGNSSKDIPGEKFVVFIQNHDEVGNRAKGERLSELVSFEAGKFAASLMLLSPFVPMLFMGEEYGEKHPFLYFIDHSDEKLVEAVRKGRKREFKAFGWKEEPEDPYDPETFKKSKLDWAKLNKPSHRMMHKMYSDLIQLRKSNEVLKAMDKFNQRIEISGKKMLQINRTCRDHELLILANLSSRSLSFELPANDWQKIFDTSFYTTDSGNKNVSGEISLKKINLHPLQLMLYKKEN